MDPIKARMNELEFLEICYRVYNYKKDINTLKTFFIALSYLIEFNSTIIIELSKEIFEIKFKPTKEELIVLMLDKGYNKKQLITMFHIARETMNKRLSEELPIFPRTTKDQQHALDMFLKEYKKLFEIDYLSLL